MFAKIFIFIFAALALHAAPPNIVLFVADDMGWNEVGYHGSKFATPNIDRLAKEGTRLDRFYVHPVCSPTRAALMTGRSPARFGVLGPIGRGVVPVDEHFLPQTFQKAGYQTFMTGKWHLGTAGPEYAPNARGFDHFYGCLGGVIDYFTHRSHRRLDWQRNGKTIDEEGYSTDLFAAEAIRLLKARKKKNPVFLYVPFNAPHQPAQAPEALLEKNRQRGFVGRPLGQAAAIEAMDAAIGQVLTALKDEGMAKDTLVMFFSDNGSGLLRRRGVPEGQLALRGGKGSVLEGGIRVPAVLRWPGVIRAGAKCEQLISAQDLMLTLCAAAGIKPANQKLLDGVNLWPAIAANKPMARAPVVVAGRYGEFAVLHGQWKLIVDRGEVSLFDVRKDPAESKEVSAQHPLIAAELAEVLYQFIDSRGAAEAQRK